ncbi:MAG TPA: STAS domain-containing protein [Solirubrobacteraceae bacterium]|jgi:anti-sigma B factor antagonist
MSYLNCPECGLTVALRGLEAPLEHCPRCIARRRKAVRMSSVRPGHLEIREASMDARHTLCLGGEMDFVTAPALEARVVQLCAAGACEIILDLTALSFIDSRGLMAILLSRKRCESRGCEFSMTRGQDPVQRLFEVTGFIDKLPFRQGGSPARYRRRRKRHPGQGMPAFIDTPARAKSNDGRR